MTYSEPAPPPNRVLTLVLLSLLVIGAIALFYGNEFLDSGSGIAALLIIPAALGGLISQLSDPAGKQSPMGCFVWPTLFLLAIIGTSWLVLGEGAICIAMVLPIWIPAAVFGAVVNRLNARRHHKWASTDAAVYSLGWLTLPLIVLTLEHQNPPRWSDEVVEREVLVDAKPTQIWPHVLSITNIRPDEGKWNVTQSVLGVPRPSNAKLLIVDGRPVRKAEWGADVRFEERIVELQSDKKIVWEFAFPDSSVQQHTDRHISPDGAMLRIASGSYELTEIAPGKTLVRLSTKYRMRTRLPGYIRWWGDRLLGDIQANVLSIVQERVTRELENQHQIDAVT